MVEITTEEAIKELSRYTDQEFYTPQNREAHRMAIEALVEKQNRENMNPLTIEELIQMQDQPVWVQRKEEPLDGHWGIVEGASEFEGRKWLYLRGHYGEYEIDAAWVAYRHKQKG